MKPSRSSVHLKISRPRQGGSNWNRAWRAVIDGYGDPVPQSESIVRDNAVADTSESRCDDAPAGAAPDRGSAWFAGRLAGELIEATDDPTALDGGGWWAVLITFEGERRFWRFAQVESAERPVPRRPSVGVSAASGFRTQLGASSREPGRLWSGPRPEDWRSSLDRNAYLVGVRRIRHLIRDGEVYQVNLCRVLTAPLPNHGRDSDPWALQDLLTDGNPAPYAGVIDVPELNGIPGTRLVCASPELFLERERNSSGAGGWDRGMGGKQEPGGTARIQGRWDAEGDGDRLTSSPIKGTGATEADLLPKDRAENVMIVDLVRNDLQRVSRAGTIEVPSLLRLERHPGLVHLVSTVQGRMRAGATWSDVFAATLPAGSVSGAPKGSALRAISELEPVPRGPYCGAIGFIDADHGYARLAVGIRTFWFENDNLHFGTGAGITWGSSPEQEWAETELKAARLIGLASNQSGNQITKSGK